MIKAWWFGFVDAAVLSQPWQKLICNGGCTLVSATLFKKPQTDKKETTNTTHKEKVREHAPFLPQSRIVCNDMENKTDRYKGVPFPSFLRSLCLIHSLLNYIVLLLSYRFAVTHIGNQETT